MRNGKSKSRTDRADYEIGYGRPPDQYKYKKGQPSPYPQGRPRGSRNYPDLAKILMEPVSLKIQGRVRKVPYMEAWVQVMKDKALKGDVRASQMVIYLAKELKILRIEDLEDVTFTLNIGNAGAGNKREETK